MRRTSARPALSKGSVGLAYAGILLGILVSAGLAVSLAVRPSAGFNWLNAITLVAPVAAGLVAWKRVDRVAYLLVGVLVLLVGTLPAGPGGVFYLYAPSIVLLVLAAVWRALARSR